MNAHKAMHQRQQARNAPDRTVSLDKFERLCKAVGMSDRQIRMSVAMSGLGESTLIGGMKYMIAGK